MYGLVDCNNFFVSCERAFQPELEGRPVVVLSNNDGCIVARSNEAKALGIKMGTPFFQVKNLVESGKLEVRSSNYTLYGDLSSRVMTLVREVVPEIEVYSIDEAFMMMDDIPKAQYPKLCRDLIVRIRRCTGIPVSIGIADTKTLAKTANHFAKKYAGYRGLCLIDTDEKRLKALSLTPIDDVWGVGWRGAPKLESYGVHTALDFVQRPRQWIQKHMGISGVRTWEELQGLRRIGPETKDRRQSICTSRSFAELIDSKDEMTLRISDFAAICAHKLRQESSVAYEIGVFMQTNRFREDLKQYYPYKSMKLDVPVSNTREVLNTALKLLDMIWKPGYGYKRAGVIVNDIVANDAIQGSLFDPSPEERDKDDTISALMDAFNTPGNSVLRLATQRPGHYAEGIRREHCSSLFSTSWNDLLKIK